jgi:ABC-type branched-subunit amino acid transport system ATPase component/branched-subunit amino acid ABC-type transport system permease component
VQDLLPFIVIGLVTGAVYGLAGTGLVLTYRTSGIFNFAHGAVAAVAAYFFYWLNVEHGLGWLLSFVLSVFVLGPIAGLLLELLAKGLAPQRPAMKIVGTIGVILLVQGLASIKFGTDPLRQPQYFPWGNERFRLGGVNVTYGQLTIVVVAVVAVILLYALFRFSRAGVAMRAVVDDPDLVSLHGTSPRRVRSLAWILGTTFAALSGVLISPMLGVEAIILTYLIVQAFGAAAVGTFSSIPLTYIGGLVVGVGSAISTKYVLNVEWLSGLPSSLPFIVLFVVLLVTPRRKLALPSRPERRPSLQWRGPPAGRLVLTLLLIGALALVPALTSTELGFYTIGLTQAIMVLSLGLLVRTAGLVSLSSAAFAAIGAVAFSQIVTNFSMPWLLAVLLGALVVVPVAGALAIPAIRLSGLFLALATFGFGLMVEKMFYARDFMFTSAGAGRVMSRPSFAQDDKTFYFVVLGFLILTAITIEVIHRIRLGRMLAGLSESPLSLSTLGLSTNTTRVLAFCIAGFFAGVGGILYGCTVNVASSSDTHYASFQSLVLLALLALAPMRAPWFAVFAIIGSVIPAYWDSPNATLWLNVIFGVFAILVAVQGGTPVMPVPLQRVIERTSGGWRARTLATTSTSTEIVSAGQQVRSDKAGLAISGLTVRFGGHTAVSDLSLTAPTGRITGLIGPNGAGKTTTFNAASGLLRPTAGHVFLNGVDVTRMGPPRRGARGLGRTFQIIQLGDSLTVRDNVRLGCEAGQAGGAPWRQVVATPAQKRSTEARTQEAMELCGITHLADLQAGQLSTGQRRLVDLARCLAGAFDVILLDEPSSGLDPGETQHMADTLRGVVEQRGIGVLLVEHDVSLIMDICDHIYVLDFGQLIFDGEPAAVAASEVVQRAYLGTADLEQDDTQASSGERIEQAGAVQA